MTDATETLQLIIPGNAQDIGARGEQQDSFGFSSFDDVNFIRHGGILAVVADGMGGMALGKDSSETAVKTVLSVYADKKPDEKISEVLDRCLHAANRAVNRRAAEAGVQGEAGTTLVAAVIHDGVLYRAGAGDSRIYLFRQGHLRQITTDYNFGRVLDRMAEKGEIERQEAESHPARAALTSYLGKEEVDEYDQPDEVSIELLPGDKILLASDGLFGFLPEGEIARLLELFPQQAAESLVAATLARKAPYQDNVTVAVLGYDLPPPVPLAETERRSGEPEKTVSTKHQPQQAAKSHKWLKIALVFLTLAVAAFIGGRYFGEQTMQGFPAATKAKPDPKIRPEPVMEKSKVLQEQQGKASSGSAVSGPEKKNDEKTVNGKNAGTSESR